MSSHLNISNQFSSVYFLGIGGIGMSALARYFNYHGLKKWIEEQSETNES